jgi:parvulin-like peptidyl-prolyl isomerase
MNCLCSLQGRLSPAANVSGLIVTLIICVLCAQLAGAQGLQGPPPPDSTQIDATPLAPAQDAAKKIVARVDGSPIFQSELEANVANLTKNQKLPPGTLAKVQATVLQQLIDRMLVREYLTSHKLLASDKEIDAGITQLRTVLQQQNTTLEDYLARTHQTEAALRSSMAFEIGWKAFVAKNSTDEMLEALFKQFHEQFDGTQRRVSHILLRPEGSATEAKLKALIDQASALRDQINSGDITFEAAAEKYSAGPSRTQGGDLGFIPRKGVMADAFSQAAFALKQGEISQPVATPFGIHLIKVTDIKPGKKTWQDVRDELQPALSEFLLRKLINEQVGNATLEFAAGVPHFKKGTDELEVDDHAANLQ